MNEVLGTGVNDACMVGKTTAVDGYGKVPNLDIQEILKTSYNALEDPGKDVFLDVACFLNGKNKNYVIKKLESSHLNPVHAIEVLIEKAFI